jgi:hypothetical protein
MDASESKMGAGSNDDAAFDPDNPDVSLPEVRHPLPSPARNAMRKKKMQFVAALVLAS